MLDGTERSQEGICRAWLAPWSKQPWHRRPWRSGLTTPEGELSWWPSLWVSASFATWFGSDCWSFPWRSWRPHCPRCLSRCGCNITSKNGYSAHIYPITSHCQLFRGYIISLPVSHLIVLQPSLVEYSLTFVLVAFSSFLPPTPNPTIWLSLWLKVRVNTHTHTLHIFPWLSSAHVSTLCYTHQIWICPPHFCCHRMPTSCKM